MGNAAEVNVKIVSSDHPSKVILEEGMVLLNSTSKPDEGEHICPEGMVLHEATRLCWDKHEFTWNDFYDFIANYDYRSTEDIKDLMKKHAAWFAKVEVPQLIDSHDKPMVSVSHFNAKKICKERGMRLPTSGEWKAVADHSCPRGPDGKFLKEKNCGYTVIKDNVITYTENGTVINVKKSGPRNTIEVCSTGEDPNGLCNMIGNVMEWTQDIPITCGSSSGGDFYTECGIVWPSELPGSLRVGFRCVTQPDYGPTGLTTKGKAANFTNRLIISVFRVVGLSDYLGAIWD